jgi:hypothetical protein
MIVNYKISNLNKFEIQAYTLPYLTFSFYA